MKKIIQSGYYYDEDEYDRVDRLDDPQEIAIAAIAYNYGISKDEAIEEYKTISEDKLKDFISYYFRRDIPQKQKDEYKKSTDDAAQEVCDAIFSSTVTGGSNMDISEKCYNTSNDLSEILDEISQSDELFKFLSEDDLSVMSETMEILLDIHNYLEEE